MYPYRETGNLVGALADAYAKGREDALVEVTTKMKSVQRSHNGYKYSIINVLKPLAKRIGQKTLSARDVAKLLGGF